MTDTTLDRGERLAPSRFSRLYWPLTRLRKRLCEIIQDHVAVGSYKHLVDYGCGNMPYRDLFLECVEDYVGCDLAGNPHAAMTLGDGNVLPLEDNSKDIVFSSQVLEHVESPKDYLSECRRVLSDRGLLILSTHGVWRFHPDPTDYWRWTSSGLRKIVEEAGFQVREIHGELGPPAYALQILQDAGGFVLPRFLRPLFYAGMQILIQLADFSCPRRIREQDACIFVVVATTHNDESS